MGDFCRGERQTDTPCKESLGMNLFSVLWREKEREERRGKKRERQRGGGKSRSYLFRREVEEGACRLEDPGNPSCLGRRGGVGSGQILFLKGPGYPGDSPSLADHNTRGLV